jgi:probable rRNA maturation factor
MTVSIHVNRLDEWAELEGLEERVRRAAQAALDTAEEACGGELSITFVRGSEIQALNHEYLGHDRGTDVIAFDLGNDEALLGDVYVSPEEAGKNAAALGLPLQLEVLRLVVHGMLHLMGHDHPEGEGREESEMFRLQEELLRGLGEG